MKFSSHKCVSYGPQITTNFTDHWLTSQATPPHISCHTPTADKDIEQCSGGPAEGLDLPSPTNYTNGVRCETLEEKSTIVSESRLEPEIAIPIPSVRSLVLAGESKDNLMISEEQNTSGNFTLPYTVFL
jgi:hypothetical protein